MNRGTLNEQREAREAKLPLWAQKELGRLRRDLASAYEKLATGPENSNTFANPYSSAVTPLGRDTVVEFRGDDNTYRVSLNPRGDLDVIMTGRHSLWMAVHPRAANSIEISGVKR